MDCREQEVVASSCLRSICIQGKQRAFPGIQESTFTEDKKEEGPETEKERSREKRCGRTTNPSLTLKPSIISHPPPLSWALSSVRREISFCLAPTSKCK